MTATETDSARRVPLTPDGVPDVEAMRATGLGAHADEWERRMKIVSEFCLARRKVGYGRVARAAQRIANAYKCSPRAIYNWLKQLRKRGPVALVPAIRASGYSGSLPPDLQAAICRFYDDASEPQTPGHATAMRMFGMLPVLPTAREAHREVVLPYFQAGGADPPSYWTTQRFIKRTLRAPQGVLTRATNGTRAQPELDGVRPRIAVTDYSVVATAWWPKPRRTLPETSAH